MPIIWSDYEKKTSNLSLLEHGAYMLLLKEYWNNGGAIECERNANASIEHMRFYRSCRAMTQEEQKAIDFVLSKFFVYSDGKYHQSRADEEIAKAREKRAKARDAAGKRWKKEQGKPEESNANAYADAMRTHMPELCTSPSPSPSLIDDDSVRDSFAKISIEVQKLMKGRILNTQLVHAWIKAGADENLIIETLKVCLNKKGGEPPNSLKYFEGAIIEAIRQKNEIIEVKNGIKQDNRQNGIQKYGKRSITDITTELFAEIDAGTF